MESTHATLNLYMPISERSYVSPSLSHSRGPAPLFKAPLNHHGGLTSNYKEEGQAETVKQGQADKIGLSNLKEALKVLDDCSEFWPTELFPLCLECQTSMSMGNQQGTKIKPNSHGYAECCDALPKSPRLQIPLKRRRRVDGLVYTGSLQHNARMTAGTPQAPPKARRLTKLPKTSSPTFEEWDLKENRSNVCTPAAWRKRVTGKERVSLLEERNRSSKKLKPAWKVKLPDAPSANVNGSSSKKRKDLSVKEECALPDSDTDLSEYDNDLYSTCTSPIGKTEDSNSNSQNAQITQEERDTDEEKKAEGVEKKSSQWRCEEMEKKAAAWRVMGKIEEVEGIIRRVSLTSLDCIKEDSDRKDEPQFISDGGFGETQEKGCNEDELLLTEELQALGEALSLSLCQVLTMEGAKPESEAKKTFHEPNLVGTTKRPLNLPSYSYHFTSTLPKKSSSSSLSPSLSLSAILDVSPRTSSNFEGMSPSLPLSLTEQNEKVISATILSGTGNYEKNGRKIEQNQTYRQTSETEDSGDHLLSSDEALQRQEQIWQQEVEESLSFCRSLSHPSRPKHIDFLRITAPEDDIIDTPTSTPLQPEFQSEASTSGEGEERTPGRLQAVWPPLKEEKVGLKYTEAEHQAALLQLKRECKEEVEKLQEEFGQELSRLRGENKDNVARLELTLAELQAELSQFGTRQRGECKDVAVSTGDDFLNKSFRTVCIQTDRETFVKTPEDGEGAGRAYTSPQQQKVTPKKLDLASISLSLAGQRDDAFSSPSYDPPSQTLPPPGTMQPTSEQPPAPSQTTNTDSLPPPPPPPCLSFPLNHMQPSNGPPPPPPPPPSMPGFIPPPPPPPSMPGLMPLPPPPPPVGGFSVEVPPRKPTVEPSRPMKPLYWTRIQIQDKNNKTLWNILEEPNIINASEFEELLAKTTTQTKRKPLSEAYQKKAKARKIIKLLDGKRSQAVGILISSLHLEMKDIQQAVLAVDHSVVDLETIEALYENRAQPEELERIKKHYETSEEEEVKLLDKPEQFLYELSQIPDFAGRARCIIFQSVFIDGIASIQHKLNTVSSVCKALLESNGVTEVMGLVLALGNYMNGGNRTRGQADGFGLEILPKLKDVKSKDNRISLVDYVVSYYLHNVDKHSGTENSIFPLPEPQDVFLAAQVKFDDLNRDLRQLGRDLTRCEKDVQKVFSDSPVNNLQPFKDKMEAFVLSARKEHAEASHLLMTIQKSFQDLVLYFGLKPKSGEKEVTPAYLLMLWFEFCADFKARWKKENKTISNERLKEAQLSVKRITAEKKVETRKINPNSLKERLRQKEANMSST
ncbi:formin isoform X1 [Etheostoma cragini]|uniref:formin isoform X1 n=1 Tax=Etheostoma cragini TaxID=417921 RepID=UPI00155F29A3|nr:formin isoform X1 [Etheostoma cragini]